MSEKTQDLEREISVVMEEIRQHNADMKRRNEIRKEAQRRIDEEELAERIKNTPPDRITPILYIIGYGLLPILGVAFNQPWALGLLIIWVFVHTFLVVLLSFLSAFTPSAKVEVKMSGVAFGWFVLILAIVISTQI